MTMREFESYIGCCKYKKCTHTKEEGCAVLEKLQAGQIAASRHENYITIGEEIRKKPQWKREKEEENARKKREKAAERRKAQIERQLINTGMQVLKRGLMNTLFK